MITGIDCSRYQGEIDWAKLNANPEVGFVIIKAGGGAHDGYGRYVDSQFKRNWTLCQRPKAGYWYWQYADDGVWQARYYFDEITKIIGDTKMRPVLDFEDVAAPVGANAPSALTEFYEEAQAKWFSRTPLGYTRQSWWDEKIKRDICGSNPLWVANYPWWWQKANGDWRDALTFQEFLTELPKHTGRPAMPKTGGWDDWKVWQFSSHGRVDGIAGDVDLDIFNGTQQELEDFFYFGSIASPPPIPPLPPDPVPGDLETRLAAAELLLAAHGARLRELEDFRTKVKSA